MQASEAAAGGGAGEQQSEANKALFLEKVRQSNSACQTGDFEKAISLYTEAIHMDKNNHILYSNRYLTNEEKLPLLYPCIYQSVSWRFQR